MKHYETSPAADFIKTLGTHLYSGLIVAGTDEKLALTSTETALVATLETFAGDTVYIAKKPLVEARQAQALEDLKYMPAHEVDRKHGFSRGYVAKLKRRKLAEKKT